MNNFRLYNYNQNLIKHYPRVLGMLQFSTETGRREETENIAENHQENGECACVHMYVRMRVLEECAFVEVCKQMCERACWALVRFDPVTIPPEIRNLII